MSVRLYAAPHTVGAVSNRTGHPHNWGYVKKCTTENPGNAERFHLS
ncbi:MAG: hypothetical protein OXT74_11765 [Candidatus Poribacteria bacterium]|nr:hypothetical protein [Candidatus Poribacteria bacterium]